MTKKELATNNYIKRSQPWALQALNRDNWKCKICNLDIENTSLVVHHLDESRKNGYKSMNNELYNLITLCRKCHAKIHKFTQDPVIRIRVAQMKLSGMSLGDIGKIMGISRQRVYAILWNNHSGKAGKWEEIPLIASNLQ